MKKIKKFHVFSELYGVNLFVLIGMPAEKVRPYLEKAFKIEWPYDDDDHLKGGALFEFDKYPYQVLWISDKANNKQDLLPKISHEIFHHVLRQCKKRNIPTYPYIDNLIMDEPAAYLMEYYTRKILEKI